MSQTDIDSIRDVDCLKNSVSPGEWSSRVDLAACYHMIRRNGWNMGIFNHCSMRVPNEPDYFLIKAHALLWDEVTASNLIKVNMFEELDEKVEESMEYEYEQVEPIESAPVGPVTSTDI